MATSTALAPLLRTSGDGGWDVFGYTAQFGNGFSGTISAEVQRRTKIVNAGSNSGALSAGGFIGLTTSGTTSAASLTNVIQAASTVSSGYEGHDYPDLVGNLRVDQAWGSAQVMGALHNVAAQYYSSSPNLSDKRPSRR